MNRRGFLKFAGMGALGAAAAVALPSIVSASVPTPYPAELMPVGTPYHVDDCMYFGGRRLIVDVDCPEDRIYFFDSRGINRTPDGVFIVREGWERTMGMITYV